MSRLSNLRKLKKAVNAEHGDGTMGLAATVGAMKMPRLSTGSLGFDFATGGGLPAGRVTILWGSESSGKTTGAYRTAGQAQGLCANCLRPAKDLTVVEEVDEDTGEVEFVADATCDCYAKGLFEPRIYPEEMTDKGTMKMVETVDDKGKKKKISLYDLRLGQYAKNSYEEFRVALIDQEGAFDSKWASKVGLDERRLYYTRPHNAEDMIDIYESLMLTGSVDLFIVDSIAVLTPSKEIEASSQDWQQGLQARLVNKWNRVVNSALNTVAQKYGRVPTQIWINQERIDIQKKFGSKKTMPGGKQQLFSASVIANMWASKWQTEVADSDLKETFRMEMGKEVQMNFYIQKNKTAPARVTGSYVMGISGRAAGKVLDTPYVMAQAEKFGLTRKESASKWHLGNEVFRTKGAMMARMEEPLVFAALRESILNKMLQAREEL